MVSLDEYKVKLDSFRSRNPGKHLSDKLRLGAVALLNEYPIGNLSTQLNIPTFTLRRWQKTKTKPRFVREKDPIPTAPGTSVAVASQPVKKNGYELEIEQESSKTVMWFENENLVSIFFKTITDKSPIIAINLRNKVT